MMPAYSAILRSLDVSRFTDIFNASARKSRETFFSRHRIRTPKNVGSGLNLGRKNEARIAALHAALAHQDDDEMAEALLRTWLLGRRPLLAACLDYLGIAHTDGLTESDDVQKIAELKPEELSKLVAALRERDVAPTQDIALYLKYMGAQNVDSAIS
jgi:hypothetical protein